VLVRHLTGINRYSYVIKLYSVPQLCCTFSVSRIGPFIIKRKAGYCQQRGPIYYVVGPDWKYNRLPYYGVI